MEVSAIIVRDDYGIPLQLPQLLARSLLNEISSGRRTPEDVTTEVQREYRKLLPAVLREAESRLMADVSRSRGQTDRLRKIDELIRALHTVRDEIEANETAASR